MKITVAVIVRPGAPEPAAALRALAVAGAPDPLVVRAEAQRGMAMARNEALARCPGDVLALIEDDIAVGPGWWAALRDVWALESPAIGFAGGPIVPRIAGERPAWLTDELLTAFALDDRGPENARTFHGGNVSFDVEGLRGVGGFWPVRGGPDSRNWFSDEHLAQNALLDAGWARRHDSALTVERLIDPAATSPAGLLRRRARYGASLQAMSGAPRTVGDTLVGVGRSSAGTLQAAARRRPDLVVERAARAAQGVGALLGPRLVHDELQPVVTSTPFRHTVPPPAARRSRRPRRPPVAAGTVLLYHRVADVDEDRLGLAVHPDRFAAQMAELAARADVVALSATPPPGTVAVTFDDGYADNLHTALPVLLDHGIPATLFASTGHIARQAGFWWDEVGRLLHEAPPDAGPLRLGHGSAARVWPSCDPATRTVAAAQIHQWLQAKPPEEIEAQLRTLRVWAGRPAHPAPPPDADRPMTVDELRAFAAADGMQVGAHGRTHPSLPAVTAARQDDEIAGSRGDLAGWLGAASTAFSYPFGIPGCDVDREVTARVRAAGFTHAVINATVPDRRRPDPWAIARVVAPDATGTAFTDLLR